MISFSGYRICVDDTQGILVRKKYTRHTANALIWKNTCVMGRASVATANVIHQEMICKLRLGSTSR